MLSELGFEKNIVDINIIDEVIHISYWGHQIPITKSATGILRLSAIAQNTFRIAAFSPKQWKICLSILSRKDSGALAKFVA